MSHAETNEIRIQVTGYRSISEKTQVDIRVGSGVTAFLGPNNAGKTTVLRLIHEFRSAFQNLGNGSREHWQGNPTTLGVAGSPETGSLFHDDAQSGIKLKIFITDLRDKFEVSGIGLFLEVGSADVRLTWFSSDDTYAIEEIKEVSRRKIKVENAELSISRMMNVLAALGNSFYVPSNRYLVNLPGAMNGDLPLGLQLIDQMAEAVTGASAASARSFKRIERNLESIFGLHDLSIRLQKGSQPRALIGDVARSLEGMGAGFSHFLQLLFAIDRAKPAFVLIDEPENGLHPALQLSLTNALGSRASVGLIIATHSIGLARASANRIYVAQYEEGETRVVELGQNPDTRQYLGEMSYSSVAAVGADHVLLVEGVSDIRAMRAFLDALGLGAKAVLLQLGGDGLASKKREKELQELKGLGVPVLSVVDSERTAANKQASSARRGFKATCEKFGWPVCLTSKRSFECYFPQYALDAVFGTGAHATLGDFGKSTWDKNENYRVAAAMSSEDIKTTDIGQFLIGNLT